MCFKERQTPASCVGCFSFLTLAGAIATGYFAMQFTNENYKSADPFYADEGAETAKIDSSTEPEIESSVSMYDFFGEMSTGSSLL